MMRPRTLMLFVHDCDRSPTYGLDLYAPAVDLFHHYRCCCAAAAAAAAVVSTTVTMSLLLSLHMPAPQIRAIQLLQLPNNDGTRYQVFL